MWQDYVIATTQIVFAVSIIPTLLHAEHKPTLSTSLWTAGGLFVLTVVYVSLELWLATLLVTLNGILWSVLAYQRYRLNRRGHH